MRSSLREAVLIGIAIVLLSGRAEAQFSFLKGNGSQQLDQKVEVTADQLEYDKNQQKVIGRGNVVVVHGEDKLIADYAEVYTEEKRAHAEGHVMLTQGDSQMVGEVADYNFATHQGSFPQGELGSAPWIAVSDDMQQVSTNKAIMRRAQVTTCDRAHDPHYALSAKKVIVYLDDKIVALNCFVTVLGKKIFWWPYISLPLNEQLPFEIKPGYSSKWGAYALASKGFSINKYVGGRLHYDYRVKRGNAIGTDLAYDFPYLGKGLITGYYARDKRSPDNKAADPESTRLKDDRYRLKWQHQVTIDDNTYVMAEYNKLHDKYVLKDFFEKEYRSETDPETYVNMTHATDKYSVLVNTEKRVNNFVDTTEKLPEVRFNWNNNEIMDTNIYHKNETSIINFNKKRAGSDVDDDVVRGSFFNEISYPKNVQQINVKPFLNSRQDMYSKNASGKEWINRNVFGGGVDTSTRFNRVYDVKGDFMGIMVDKLKHIVEPSIRYNSIREASVPYKTLFQMDEVDELDDLDEVIFGLRNKFQTKRTGKDGKVKRVDLFCASSYVTYEFNRELVGGSKWLDYVNEFEFRPYEWLILYHKHTWNIVTDQFSSASFDAEMNFKEKWHFYLSHKFINDDPQETDDPSCLVTLDAEYTINELWKIGAYARHEFDTQTLEEWEVRFIRNLHCWNLEFGFNRRNNEGDKAEYEVFMDLALKAFPMYDLKTGNRASFSRARFGNLLSGSSAE